MEIRPVVKDYLTLIAVLVALLLVALFLFKIKTIIVYLCISGVLTLIGKPIVTFFSNKLYLGKTLAAIITLLIFISFISFVVLLFIPLVIDQGKNLSFLNYDYLNTNSQILFKNILVFLNENNIVVNNEYISKEIVSHLNIDYLPSIINSFFGVISDLVIGLLASLFITFYLLKADRTTTRVVFTLFNKKYRNKILLSIVTIKQFLTRYFIGLFLQLSVLFIIYASALSLYEIPNALVIAFLCCLFNLIPFVGPLIGVFLMLCFSLIGIIHEDFNTVIIPTGTSLLITYAFAQLIDNFISQPIIFSKSAKSHPLEIFIVILTSGILFGIVGMIIAIPCYTSIKVVAKSFFPENRIVKSLTKDF